MEVRYLETVHSSPKHRFATFFMQTVAKCSKTLPKHRLRSTGDNWVCLCEHILQKLDTPKQCIRPRNNRFATFFMQTVAKCSKTLPKHRLRSTGDNWVCLCEHILRKFGTPKLCIRPRNNHFGNFFMQTVANRTKTLPNIV